MAYKHHDKVRTAENWTVTILDFAVEVYIILYSILSSEINVAVLKLTTV